jgi:hypothetical protein
METGFLRKMIKYVSIIGAPNQRAEKTFGSPTVIENDNEF